jgi:hypothetical protein
MPGVNVVSYIVVLALVALFIIGQLVSKKLDSVTKLDRENKTMRLRTTCDSISSSLTIIGAIGVNMLSSYLLA